MKNSQTKKLEKIYFATMEKPKDTIIDTVEYLLARISYGKIINISKDKNIYRLKIIEDTKFNPTIIEKTYKLIGKTSDGYHVIVNTTNESEVIAFIPFLGIKSQTIFDKNDKEKIDYFESIFEHQKTYKKIKYKHCHVTGEGYSDTTGKQVTDYFGNDILEGRKIRIDINEYTDIIG